MAEPETIYCARHKGVETRLSCSRCETPICPQCLVQTPVGAKCPDCAQVRRLPTFELQPATYVRAIVTGVVLAGAIGTLWGLLFFDLFRIPFLPWIAIAGIGYAMGEGISAAVNRKRGRHLQYIAGASFLLTYMVAGFVEPTVFAHTFSSLFFLLLLAIGAWVAAGRVG